MPSTPSPCTLNSPPPHPQVRDLLLFITYGGGSEDLGVSRGFQGGGRGGIRRRWQSVKGGDRRNLTASKKGGGVKILQSLGGGGAGRETGKFKLNFSDPLPSLLPGDNKWSLRRIQMWP